jgi:hypothetical protein
MWSGPGARHYVSRQLFLRRRGFVLCPAGQSGQRGSSLPPISRAEGGELHAPVSPRLRSRRLAGLPGATTREFLSQPVEPSCILP